MRLSPLLLLPGLAGCAATTPAASVETVHVDFEMAERAIDWVQLAHDGASDEELRERFFATVAPTEGCQVIVRHWARFREWNEELFFEYAMKGLGRMPSDEPLVDEQGSRTRYGVSRETWGRALADPGAVRADLEALRAADPARRGGELARRYLPADASITNDFYVVLFGGSTAFSVGEANGFDLLQMPKRADGSLDVERTVKIFAHEMHHSGFDDAVRKHMGAAADLDELNLVGVLTAEGSATCLVNRTRERLDELRSSHDPGDRELAADWDRHLANLDALYALAQEDVRKNLAGELSTDDLVRHWLAGAQGPAYVVGADMIATIERELGLPAVLEVIQDYRRLLSRYDRAAIRANEAGASLFVFDQDLADAVAAFGKEP